MGRIEPSTEGRAEPRTPSRTTPSLVWAVVFLLVLSALALTASVVWPRMEGVPDALAQLLYTQLRLPRACGAWLAGALLALSGALAQGLFRNDLADPYLLGSSSGAALGVALLAVLTVLGSASATVQVAGLPWAEGGWLLRLGASGAAFGGALLAVFLTLLLSGGARHTVRLLLAGLVVGVVLGSLTSLLVQLSPQVMQRVQSYTLGSTSGIDAEGVGILLLALLLALPWALREARSLDALSLGEATALSLGIAVAPLYRRVIVLMALTTGLVVAQTGPIAFVGLAAPHMVRSLWHVSHRALLLLSALTGGLLLLVSDAVARWVLSPQELPVGIVTALVGGVYLLALLARQRPGGRR